MRVLGVDFGTSNTVAAVRTDQGQTRTLLFDGTPLLPSGVYLGVDGRLLAGRDAQRAARTDPGRFEPHPKRCVDDGQVLLGDTECPVHRLFAAVLATVAAEAHRQLGGSPDQVWLTHPAQWGERRRGVLAQAAATAGMGTVALVSEPVAAAGYFTSVLRAQFAVGASLAVYDLGGGTFDAAVVRRVPTGFEVLAQGGIPDLGGRDFDQAIVEHLGHTVGTSEPALWQRLTHPDGAAQRRARRLLYEEVRSAREMLSRTASADIQLPDSPLEVHLTRSEFETLVRPALRRTVACLARTIAGTGLAAGELAGVFLVGGASRIPLAAQLIHADLGIAPTTLEQPETVVAQGAAGQLSPASSRTARPAHTSGPSPGSALGPGPGPGPASFDPVSPGPAGIGPVNAGPTSPVPSPVAGRTGPYPPWIAPPAGRYPPPGYLAPARRPWYTEPTMIATAVVLVLVIAVSVVLLVVATR